MQFDSYTEKSKRCIIKAIKMAQDCGYKYLEPQILMAGIVNEGRDMLSYVLQYLHIDRLNFCTKVNSSISNLQEFTHEAPSLSPKVEEILETSKNISSENGCALVPIEFLFLSMILVPSEMRDVFISFDITESKLIAAIEHYRGNTDIEISIEGEREFNCPYLKKYSRDLCEAASQDQIPNAIGREEEIGRVIQVISRQTKNNPILVGEPGTGKTAIVEGLAHRIVSGDVPRNIRNVRIFSLDVAGLIAGASHVGEFEERLKGVINEVSNSEGHIILFIDEIHLLIGEGRGGGAMDAANILKPELARGRMKIIGATTIDEYKRYIELDKAFERRFQKITVEEPDEESALAIMRGIRIRLEKFHKIRIKDDAIKAAVKLSTRYIQDRFLPDKAIDLLDEAASKMKIARSSYPKELASLRKEITTKQIESESLKHDDGTDPRIQQIQETISNLQEKENSLYAKWQSERALLDEIQERRNEIARLTEDRNVAESQGIASSVVDLTLKIQKLQGEIHHLKESLYEGGNEVLLKGELDKTDIMDVITEWTGIPASKLTQRENDKLAHIEEYLNKTVIGQDEAKAAVANAIRRSRLGFSDVNRPIGSFLFLGTTGVGKTELCKVLSEYLFNSRDALIRIDMSEYQQEHEVSKLFGAPPGYIGHENGGQLTEAVRHKPYSVILFDEIEKAHPKVFETLLQVLDDGRMTDGKGRTVNFKNTIIVMTSNLGHQVIYSTLQGRPSLKRHKIGFQSETNNVKLPSEEADAITESKIAKAKSLILAELKSKVAPEFINRIDNIVMFLPLSKEDIKKIVLLQIQSLKSKIRKNGIKLRITDRAIDFLAQVGFQPEYGARPVKRAINSYLVDDLSLNIINGTIKTDEDIVVDAGASSLSFTNIN